MAGAGAAFGAAAFGAAATGAGAAAAGTNELTSLAIILPPGPDPDN